MKQFKNNTPTEKKVPSEKAKKEMFRIIGLSLLFMLVYFGAQQFEKPFIEIPKFGYVPLIGTIVTGLYMLALLGFAVAYIGYNYAFTRKDVTPDMLPDTMSAEEKEEFIGKGKEHFQKSRWMILVIFPLIITFMAEALYLFVWTGFLEDIFIK